MRICACDTCSWISIQLGFVWLVPWTWPILPGNWMYFTLKSPVRYERLIFVYKICSSKTPLIDELIVKHNEEMLRIDYKRITHLSASGNYTLIHLNDGKAILQTRQLGMFDFLTEKDFELYAFTARSWSISGIFQKIEMEDYFFGKKKMRLHFGESGE